MSIRRTAFQPHRLQIAHYGKLSSGFTLVEVLVAVTLTLILLTAVVKVFSGVSDGISKSKKVIEEFDRLRLTESLLRQDLDGVTVTMMPPWKPDEAKGYFEYIENGYTPPNSTYGDPPAVILDPNDPRSTKTPLNYSNYNVTATTPTPNNGDTSVGQRGDILMFTTRSLTHPFIGRYKLPPIPGNSNTNNTVQSDVAEVAWFLRGRTLHRRVLLVMPGLSGTYPINPSNPPAATAPTFPAYWFQSYNPANFYHDNDISVHRAINPSNNNQPYFVANSLADLAHRENRFGHPSTLFPFDVRAQWGLLGLPTMRECADEVYMGGLVANWNSGSFPSSPSNSKVYGQQFNAPNGPTKSTNQQFDLWQNFCYDSASNTTYWLPDWYLNLPANTIQPMPLLTASAANGNHPQVTTRDADDIVLTNVIGFDVKAWDPPSSALPGYTGGYFDLGNSSARNHFGSSVASFSGYNLYQTYDTFPVSYESDGIYQFNASGVLTTVTPGGVSNNGFDDGAIINGQTVYNGMVDGPLDYLTLPPYNVPLRGIQVKIRVFEPSSRQIREVTIEHDFLPK